MWWRRVGPLSKCRPTTNSYSLVKKSAAKPFDLTIPYIPCLIYHAHPYLCSSSRGYPVVSCLHCIHHLYLINVLVVVGGRGNSSNPTIQLNFIHCFCCFLTLLTNLTYKTVPVLSFMIPFSLGK